MRVERTGDRAKVSIVALLGLATMSLVAAAPAQGAPPDIAGDDPTALAVQAYARDNGVATGAAERAIGDQRSLVASINRLDVDLGTEADVWVSQADGRQTITVRSDNEAIRAALARVSLTGGTELRVLDEVPIAARVPALTAAVEAAVRKYIPGAQGMYVRLTDGALVVETTDDPSGLNTAAVSAETGFSIVAAEMVEKASDTAITARGGVGLSSCTAGFSARNGSSYIGVYSAAHCGATQSVYTNTAGTGTSVVGTRTLQTYNANADIGFYRIPSGNYVSGTYFGSSSTTPSVVAPPQDVPEGITVCHRGKATGWTCGKITNISYKPLWTDACPNTTCNAVFVRVEAPTLGGDSGGPWVNGNAPIGIHKGGGADWSVYSKIYRIPSGTSLY